ncbi:MAG TPA: DegT/DnrJ/EryC1/StrS aminotransferase [Proteobacteria bacterium]|nr:DegT/DnrJ/EryC1/StrS aminotransferase [Pseudomonadota bacterium]
MKKIGMFQPHVSEEAIARVEQVLRSGWIGEGPVVKEFEQEIGKLLHSPYSVSVNSGTSALHLALRVAGVQAGDEVITTAQTMLATSLSIMYTGAKPVYADVQPLTGNICPQDIRKRISPKTKAILAVDWAGYPCDYDEILEVAQDANLVVVEDAAHSLGATYKERPIGSVCPYTCFSFQAIKNLTTGDGGLVCLSNELDYRTAVRLRWYGIDRERRRDSILGEPIWNVEEVGYKYHMNDIAAAIGLGNLLHLQDTMLSRRKIVEKYRDSLKSVPGITLFKRQKDRQSGDWLFSVHVERRENFCRMMRERGIPVSVVHLRIDSNDVCGGTREDLPHLTDFTKTHVSLPLHPFLEDQDVEKIIKAVQSGW